MSLREWLTRRARRALVAGASFAVVLSVSALSEAAPKDDKALKAFKQAMEEDYLDVRFDDAEKRLRGALDTCGGSGCAPAVKAKILMGLGIVLIGGKGDKDGGRKSFIEALKLDPKAEPDADYVTSDIKAAFEEAKKAAGSAKPGPGPAPAGGGPVTVLRVDEQRVNTPVPVYVTFDEDAGKKVTSVTLTYVSAGGKEEKTLELEKSGKAYRGNIPCGAVARKGTLKFWVVAKDKKGNEVGAAGSADEPFEMTVKSELDGKAPSWPGFAPPEPCAGGAAIEDSGSSRRQCIDDSDCPQNEKCSANECLLKPGDGGGGAEPDPDTENDDAKLNWIRLTFAPDFAMISGEDICGFADAYDGGTPAVANDPTYVCVRNPEGNRSRYIGRATPGQGNNVNFGFGVATMRLMLGYDRVLIKGLSLGARVGWAFNGTNEEFASFIPVHAEGRLAYTIGKNPFAGQVVRPWVALSGGLAQIDTAVDVDVLEEGEACGADDPQNVNSACTIETADGVIEPRIQTLRAIKQAGLGFAGLSVGVSFVPVTLFEINLAVRFNVTFPYVVPVFSPELGVGVGF